MIDKDKFCKRITLLEQGHTLLLKHVVYGDFKVYMNPQQNRIFAVNVDGSDRNEEDGPIIDLLLMWNNGDWFLYEKDKIEECSTCKGRGFVAHPVELVRV